MNNGHFTWKIKRTRGFDQGDPLSQPIFCLMCEPLAHSIRTNPRIQGYPLHGTGKEAKISQYADDITTYVLKEMGINYTFLTFEDFGKASGVYLNSKKTKGMMINTFVQPNIPGYTILWDICLKILGIWYFKGPKLTQQYNWLLVANKIHN